MFAELAPNLFLCLENRMPHIFSNFSYMEIWDAENLN